MTQRTKKTETTASGLLERRGRPPMKLVFALSGLALLLTSFSVLAADVLKPNPEVYAIEPDGSAHMPATMIPFSALASEEARRAFIQGVERARKQFTDPAPNLLAARQRTADALGVLADDSLRRYAVTIEPQTIGGVPTEVFTPKAGVAPENKNRILINLHGGGFFSGAGVGGRVEAVPIAGVGKIKVVSIDYRQGPEYKFPAASQDVAAVYQALMKRYKPSNIGIYGCSAGGLLTAQVVAWLQKQELPRPGAIGVFCASAGGWAGGDSAYQVASYGVMAKQSEPPPRFAISDSVYFNEADLKDPLVLPINDTRIMSKFPPTLVITGSRDTSMSVAIHTHAALVKLGVEADLHVWEGMGHGFFYDSSLPESREAYDVVAKFFRHHLDH